MTLEELRKVDEKVEDEESDEEEEDTKKSFDEALLETLSTLTDHVKAITESQISLESRLKAMETPSDLPLKPKESDSEDIGAKVEAPDTYQSNSVQASLDDDGSETEDDASGYSLQKSAETEKASYDETETPRPNAALETVNKSTSSVELNMILKDARAEGYEGLSKVAQKILRGDYYAPSEEERLF